MFLCHRDLKPDNVMTEDDGTPVVMDLGSAALARLDIKLAREATSLQVCCSFKFFIAFLLLTCLFINHVYYSVYIVHIFEKIV